MQPVNYQGEKISLFRQKMQNIVLFRGDLARKWYHFFLFLPHYFLAVTVSRGGDKHFALLFRSGNSDLAKLQSAKNRTPQISRRCLAFSVFRSNREPGASL